MPQRPGKIASPSWPRSASQVDAPEALEDPEVLEVLEDPTVVPVDVALDKGVESEPGSEVKSMPGIKIAFESILCLLELAVVA